MGLNRLLAHFGLARKSDLDQAYKIANHYCQSWVVRGRQMATKDNEITRLRDELEQARATNKKIINWIDSAPHLLRERMQITCEAINNASRKLEQQIHEPKHNPTHRQTPDSVNQSIGQDAPAATN